LHGREPIPFGPFAANQLLPAESTTTVTGIGGVTFVSGSDESLDTGLMITAKNDLTAAYNTAAGLKHAQAITTGNLGGLTLTPGVYSFSSAAQLTGTLTLNDEGNPDAVFVFQIGTSLTTATGSSVVTINGGATPGISVFWQVGSSATLGTSTAFEGNILADQSITLDSDATVLDGRLLAENGAVSLDDNTITAPPAEKITGGGGSVSDTSNTFLLLGAGLIGLFAFKRCYSIFCGSSLRGAASAWRIAFERNFDAEGSHEIRLGTRGACSEIETPLGSLARGAQSSSIQPEIRMARTGTADASLAHKSGSPNREGGLLRSQLLN
jgi:hypothetical protein